MKKIRFFLELILGTDKRYFTSADSKNWFKKRKLCSGGSVNKRLQLEI